jgi:hypothetical protein
MHVNKNKLQRICYWKHGLRFKPRKASIHKIKLSKCTFDSVKTETFWLKPLSRAEKKSDQAAIQDRTFASAEARGQG